MKINAPSIKSLIPLIRLGMAFPFLEHLEKHAVDTRPLLESLYIDGNARADFQYLMSNKAFYSIAEQASTLLNDPHCGVNLGASINLANSPILNEAFTTNIRLDAMLINFIQVLRKYSSSSHYALNVGQYFTTLQQIRPIQPSFPVMQGDAFQVGLLLQLLYVTSGHFLGGATRVCVSSNALNACVLPPQYVGVNVVPCNDGITISFPTPWLARKVQGFDDATASRESSLPLLKGEARRGCLVQSVNQYENLTVIPKHYIESFRLLLSPVLHKPLLSIDDVVAMTGISRQILQRNLKAAGTSFIAELHGLKKNKAIELLWDSTMSIAEIGFLLGFSGATSFSKAFKLWVGVSPQYYRQKHTLIVKR